MIPSKYYS